MRTTRKTTGRLRALVVAAALASTLAACGVSGDRLVFQRANSLGIVSPDDGAEVSLPLTVSWEPEGGRRLRDGFAYGVFIDTVPPAPGKSIWSLVEGRIGCANSELCRTEANLRARGAAITTEPSLLLDPIDFGTESRLGRHRVTVVVLDPEMRRIDENAYTVSFDVTSTKDSFASGEEPAVDAVAGAASTGDTSASVPPAASGSGALPGGSPAAPTATATASTGPGAASPGAAGATTTTFVPASGCGTGQLGQGVTADTIKLGLVHSSDVGAANRSLGGNTWREGEPRSNGDAFVRWFNDHGGLCGRKIVPVWVDEKVVTGASPDANDQAACTAWTQDNKIFAAMSLGNFRPNRLECLTRAGVIAIDPSSLLTMDDDAFRQHFGLLYQPFAFSLDRFFKAYVDQLAAVGYFTPGARVGLLYTDIPAEERAVRRTLIPALKARGVTLVEQARVTHTYGIDSLASSQTETNSLVLRFQTSRISHVLAPIDGFSLRTFAQRADQQNYHPRLATSTSANGNSRGGFGQSKLWENAVSVAWLPSISWDEAKASPGTKACLAILREKGVPEPRDAGVYNLSYCGFLQFLKDALGKAKDLTPAGLHAAAITLPAQVGDMAFQWKLTPARHDGAQVIRVAQYNGGEKGQWRYITGPTQVA